MESEPPSGRSSTCRKYYVICGNAGTSRRVTIREISEELDISFFPAYSIVTEDLVMKSVAVKFVPNLLTARSGGGHSHMEKSAV